MREIRDIEKHDNNHRGGGVKSNPFRSVPKNLGRTFALGVAGVLMIMVVVTGTLILTQGDAQAAGNQPLGYFTVTFSGENGNGTWETFSRTFEIRTAPGSDPLPNPVPSIIQSQRSVVTEGRAEEEIFVGFAHVLENSLVTTRVARVFAVYEWGELGPWRFGVTWDIPTQQVSTPVLVLYRAPDVAVTVPFHRGDTGAFLGNVSMFAAPNTTQTFTLPVGSRPVAPADHQWGSWSVTRNIGNGGILARYDVPLTRIQRTITWNPIGGTWTTAPPAGVSGGAINTSTNRTSVEGQGLSLADTRPGTLTRDGYTFIGWSPSGVVPASNQTRVAQWERNHGQIPPPITNPPENWEHGWNILRLNFSGGFGTSYITTRYYDNNSRALPTVAEMTTWAVGRPEFANLVFLGWYTNPDFDAATGKKVTEIPSGMTGTLTYWARWGPI